MKITRFSTRLFPIAYDNKKEKYIKKEKRVKIILIEEIKSKYLDNQVNI